MAIPELKVNESALHWDPAEVMVPSVPAIPAGEDPMSQVVAEALPGVAAKVTEMVAATRAQEAEFAANVAAAKQAYQRTDDTADQELKSAADAVYVPGAL
ncbi:PE domain-containing protein [Mycolicibacterium thermoresistibile]|uniref:PE domain-containing protein n=2 Tax=Mycolicibacterium thermoresistibile TaxID=1797 RepID=G7CDQ9_MYCT3|nr:PE domain-containing protein [Mycolicibacterium thermoresistibile]EHI14083.1 hypothetical protein KEK_05567 [Mycolicibacterium thermoresistibile ATCC 19527]MCV7189466.1 PE domain-containing protein [Mycolicibacterium thermoresistibile]GAT15135.1 putative uncharacterized protein [Mycolicibacterium thermoresistibile]SNW16317.1 PE family protein [Mycolicibacterium thermoresistibile]